MTKMIPFLLLLFFHLRPSGQSPSHQYVSHGPQQPAQYVPYSPLPQYYDQPDNSVIHQLPMFYGLPKFNPISHRQDYYDHYSKVAPVSPAPAYYVTTPSHKSPSTLILPHVIEHPRTVSSRRRRQVLRRGKQLLLKV